MKHYPCCAHCPDLPIIGPTKHKTPCNVKGCPGSVAEEEPV